MVALVRLAVLPLLASAPPLPAALLLETVELTALKVELPTGFLGI